jgi:hypothetical protein
MTMTMEMAMAMEMEMTKIVPSKESSHSGFGQRLKFDLFPQKYYLACQGFPLPVN